MNYFSRFPYVAATAAAAVMLCTASPAAAQSPAAAYDAAPQIRNYALLVYATYKDTLKDALALQSAVDAFLADPTETTLAKAKEAWLASRDSYGQTEAFRFYEGPIDFVNEAKGEEGPEGRLNSWPLNEAYIDYVEGNPKSGIINDGTTPVTRESLTEKNQQTDEADVATGYHAVEFLLWGQDLSKEGPGARPASDYAKGDAAKERRRTYLKSVTDLLVEDIHTLEDAWDDGTKHYAAGFIKADQKETLTKILSALATLSGFELASERMATSLDSGDQEDEHSCFSDNTHKDFIANAKGIANVYFGTYGSVKGPSFHDLVKAKDVKLAEKLEGQLKESEKLIGTLPHPIDREILSTPAGSPARKQMEAAVVSLQKQAELFKEAGKALGLEVQIMSE